MYHPRAKTARTPNDIQYSFTEVLDEHATQEGVFATTALRGVRDVLQMKNNALVFTLGVTNSGKTFTMQGTEFNAGIVPRSITTLFTGLSRNMAPSYTFKVDDATRVPYVQVSEPCLMRGQARHVTPHGRQAAADISSDRARNRRTSLSRSAGDDVDPAARELQDDVDPDSVYAVFISFIEIYNEKIVDLGKPPGQ